MFCYLKPLAFWSRYSIGSRVREIWANSGTINLTGLVVHKQVSLSRVLMDSVVDGLVD